MRSLADHLSADTHGTLPFHPSCPVCRAERLFGEPPPDRVVPTRAIAGLAAAALLAGPAYAPMSSSRGAKMPVPPNADPSDCDLWAAQQ